MEHIIMTKKIEEPAAVVRKRSRVVAEVEESAVEVGIAEVVAGIEEAGVEIAGGAEVVADGVEAETKDAGVTVEDAENVDVLEAAVEIEEFMLVVVTGDQEQDLHVGIEDDTGRDPGVLGNVLHQEVL